MTVLCDVKYLCYAIMGLRKMTTEKILSITLVRQLLCEKNDKKNVLYKMSDVACPVSYGRLF